MKIIHPPSSVSQRFRMAAALLVSLFAPVSAYAQSMTTLKTDTVSLMQDVVDIMIAGAVVLALVNVIRGAQDLIKLNGRSGDVEGHHIVKRFGAAAVLVMVGVILYAIQAHFGANGGANPTVAAPTITPN